MTEVVIPGVDMMISLYWSRRAFFSARGIVRGLGLGFSWRLSTTVGVGARQDSSLPARRACLTARATFSRSSWGWGRSLKETKPQPPFTRARTFFPRLEG